MDTKEYLGQAYKIDRRIDSKLEQLESLHALVTKTGSAISDMPRGGGRDVHRMERTLVKIADMENEVREEMELLVDLKAEIMERIGRVPDGEQRTLLEQRYLCFKTWEQIAVQMGYHIRHVYRLHAEALESIKNQGL